MIELHWAIPVHPGDIVLTNTILSNNTKDRFFVSEDLRRITTTFSLVLAVKYRNFRCYDENNTNENIERVLTVMSFTNKEIYDIGSYWFSHVIRN